MKHFRLLLSLSQKRKNKAEEAFLKGQRKPLASVPIRQKKTNVNAPILPKKMAASTPVLPKKTRKVSSVRLKKVKNRPQKTWQWGCTKHITAQGRNVELLLLRLKREKIPLIRFEKGEKVVVLEVHAILREKVFAILRTMCYNIIRESTGGKALPLYYLSRRVGAVLGAAVFFLGCLWARPVVFAVEYRGGAAYRRAEFSQTLQESGVFIGARVSSQALSEAKKALYAAYPSLYFVSVEKRGFRITVTAEGAIPTPPPLFLKELIAPTGGVVLRVNVLRGTPAVTVGEAVACGQQLASGSFLSGETVVEGYVVGEIILLSKHTESVVLPARREDLPAMLLSCSMHQRGIENATEVHLTIEKEAEGYRHTASYTYTTVVRGG